MSPRNERNTPWKKSDVLLLLDLYESEPVLYDNTLLLYKSQSCRQDALERIAKHFPNKTVTDIKTKIGNLRGQFSNEKIKLKRAKKTNDLTYSPYWFSKIRFLDSFLKTRSSSSTFSLSTDEIIIQADLPSKKTKLDKDGSLKTDSLQTDLALRTNQNLRNNQKDGINHAGKYTPSIDAFGEFVKSIAAQVPEDKQDEFIQKSITFLFAQKRVLK